MQRRRKWAFRQAARQSPPRAECGADIVALAIQYGRYGYRRVTAMLRSAGWTANLKRVELIWR